MKLHDPTLDDLFEEVIKAAMEYGQAEQTYNRFHNENRHASSAGEYRLLERARLKLDKLKFDFITLHNTQYGPYGP